MAIVRIPSALRSEFGDQRSISLPATNVADALERLIGMFPALAGRLLEGDALPPFLNVFVDGQDIRMLAGLATRLEPESIVLILPAMAGGSYELHGLKLDRLRFGPCRCEPRRSWCT